MTRHILFSLLALLVMSGAFAQNDITNSVSIDRKINHFLSLEGHIYSLPVDKTEIIETILPKIESNRHQIAPNFPEKIYINHAVTSQETKEDELKTWILSFPEEHDQYRIFLEDLIRSYLH